MKHYLENFKIIINFTTKRQNDVTMNMIGDIETT